MLRRPLRDDLAATGAAFRTEVDDPVGSFYYIEIMLDDYDSITLISQPVNHFQQQRDVVEVQAGGRFVEDVQSPTRVALAQFQRKFDALRFAARQRGRRLAEPDIARDPRRARFSACARRSARA